MTDMIDKETFWDRMDGVQAGFLGTESGASRPVPMSHYVDREAGCLWFITADGTDLAEALEMGPKSGRYMVASGQGNIYARIDGQLTLVKDSAKIDELWNAIVNAWFEDGQRDDDIRLVRMDLSEAEVWATPGKLGFLYEIAKSQGDDTPDMGEYGTLRFAA